MVLTETPICHFGWQPQDFSLINIDGKKYNLTSCMGEKGLVVVFACNHCPYVKAILDLLIKDAISLQSEGINTVMINSNDSVNYPEDSYENMQIIAKEKKFPFLYLFDESQEVAKNWDAVCTPDFFGFNKDLQLQYRGRLDSSGKNADPDSKRELLEAMTQIAKTNQGPEKQIPSMGCSIKWKA